MREVMETIQEALCERTPDEEEEEECARQERARIAERDRIAERNLDRFVFALALALPALIYAAKEKQSS